MPLTSDQVCVGGKHNPFHLSQDDTASTMYLTTPHFKTKTPTGAAMRECKFAILSTWMLEGRMKTARKANRDTSVFETDALSRSVTCK